MNFDKAFTMLLGHEGGYSNHPNDPGGETMWGITRVTARENGYTGAMRFMPVEVAKAIYRRKYWDSISAEALPMPIRYAMFDAAVNSGVTRSIMWLQEAVDAAADGKLGPITLGKVGEVDPYELKSRLIGSRLMFMTKLSTWPTFSKGWARRIAGLLSS